jgi:S-formylglutathione hydrolase FrmB
MDIIKAREEAKLEKNVKNALKHPDIVRSTMHFSGGSAKPKLAGRKKRRMSAASRLAISKATKARWAKVQQAKTAKPRRKGKH